MKKLVVLIVNLLILCLLNAQNITEYPYVSKPYPSDAYGANNIILVLNSEDGCVVVLEYITSRNSDGGWISIDSKTMLTDSKSSIRYKIIDWGIIYDSENVNSLNFDEKYSVTADRKYLFYLEFPTVPSGINNISIRESLPYGFYWEGIHIKNSRKIKSKGNDYFRDYDYSDMDVKTKPEKPEISGSGSCFAISSSGLIATAYHVVENASVIQIRGINGDFDKTYKAKLLLADKNNDLAILKINDEKFTGLGNIPYTLSDKIADVGEDVFALGYPLRSVMGDDIKLTNGLISSKSGYQSDITSYQISVAVHPGNSGCPLFDSKGNIIGIINSKLYIESAAYAVKSMYLKSLISSLDERIDIPSYSHLSEKTRTEQIKDIVKFVYIVEIQ